MRREILIFGILLLLVCYTAFAAGWKASELFSKPKEITASTEKTSNIELAQKKLSPFDWVKEDKIKVYSDKIVIEIPDARWAKFSDTHSMEPVLDKNSNALQIVPKDISDIHTGDIISYETSQGTIIHRVVELGFDGEWYAITKGDNNSEKDSEKVRFSQIKKIVIGVVY